VSATASKRVKRQVCAVPRLALGPEEAAAAIGVSRDFLDEHIAGELRWTRRGRRKLVAVAELERWLERSSARTLP
jgi:excisionase family DNA binding protein